MHAACRCVGCSVGGKRTEPARRRPSVRHGLFRYEAQHWRAMSTSPPHNLSQIRCPALILHGEKDELFTWEHASTLHRGIAGSELRCIRGQGHDLHDDNLDAWVGAMMRGNA